MLMELTTIAKLDDCAQRLVTDVSDDDYWERGGRGQGAEQRFEIGRTGGQDESVRADRFRLVPGGQLHVGAVRLGQQGQQGA